ncbi:MAG: endonuclease/exonuclease/phosphatase family protein [Marinicella sp.]
MNKHFITSFSFTGLLQVACLGVVICTFAPLLSDWYWWFDLLSHFRVQYALLSLLFLLGFVFSKRKVFSVIALIVLSANVYLIWPHLAWGASTQNGQNTQTFKLFHANVYTANQQHQLLINQLNEEQPDVIILQEIDHEWLKSLSVLNQDYPHRIELPRSDNFGLAVFSRLPIENERIHNWTTLDIPSVEFSVSSNKQLVNIITTHSPPPVNRYYFDAIAKQFHAIAQIINNNPNTNHVVIGDLNTTVWSQHYQILDSIEGIKNARAGFGLLPTWPTDLLPMMIPIDHCLVSEHINVTNIKTGQSIDSDHLPLIVELN